VEWGLGMRCDVVGAWGQGLCFFCGGVGVFGGWRGGGVGGGGGRVGQFGGRVEGGFGLCCLGGVEWEETCGFGEGLRVVGGGAVWGGGRGWWGVGGGFFLVIGNNGLICSRFQTQPSAHRVERHGAGEDSNPINKAG